MFLVSFLKNLIKNSNFIYAYCFVRYHSEYKKQKQIALKIIDLNKRLKSFRCSFFFLRPPEISKLTILTDEDYNRIKNWTFDFNNISKDDAVKLKSLYPRGTSLEEIVKMYEGAKVIDLYGQKTLADFSNEFVNIVSGKRITKFVPDNSNITVHIYGACTVRGTGVKDEETISSYLQLKLNKLSNGRVSCKNHGIGCGSSVYDDLSSIERTVLREGDIIVVCNIIGDITEHYLKKANIPYIQSSDEFNRQHVLQKWFSDLPVHTNRIGNKKIADAIFNNVLFRDVIDKNLIFSGKTIGKLSKVNNKNIFKWAQSKELNEYLDEIKKSRVPNSFKNGAIVMNCNPFTLGHRYLIESASKKVDVLYIFVVEENKSFFSFNDRFNLVKLGTNDLKNVIVVRSGQFIISALTFPGYFYKDQDNSAIVDTTQDIELFADYIAPVLNISVRFAGEEPIDMVTKQYNETMRKELPIHGISFVEIKRKEAFGQVISASKVRKSIESGDWDYIRTVVPVTTYNYLITRFNK